MKNVSRALAAASVPLTMSFPKVILWSLTSTWDYEIIFKFFTASASWKLRFSFSNGV
jgi:hypothetical protein